MKIYVGTYAKYNKGSIAGAWLDLNDYNDAEQFIDACYTLHNDEQDAELMFQDFDDIHKNYCRECIDMQEVYYYVDACNDGIKDVIDAGLDCEIPLDSIMDAYIGSYDSDSDFAYEMAFDMGYIDEMEKVSPWLTGAIDWNHAARELMLDNVSSKGHYFNCHF
jgi:antirestriction protein